MSMLELVFGLTRALSYLLQNLVGNVEVRVGVLDVVVLFQRLHQAQHVLGIFPFHAHRGLRHHRNVCGFEGQACALHRLFHFEELLGRAHNFVDIPGRADVLGPSLERRRQDIVFLGLGPVDRDDALPVEHPGDRAGPAQRSSISGEQVPDIAGSAVAVVGEDLDQYRDPAWGVPLVQDRLERRPFGPASPALNRTLDVVVGHPGFAPVVDRRTQARVAVGVAPALLSGDGDLAGQLAEQLAPHKIDFLLLQPDIVPLRMAGHAPTSIPSFYYWSSLRGAEPRGNLALKRDRHAPSGLAITESGHCSLTINVVEARPPPGLVAVTVITYCTPLTCSAGRNR